MSWQPADEPRTQPGACPALETRDRAAAARPRRLRGAPRCCRDGAAALGRPVRLLGPDGSRDVRRRVAGSTSGRIRTSASRRSPTSSPARSCTATASARRRRSARAQVNWMTAGRGIVHSERTPTELRAAGLAARSASRRGWRCRARTRRREPAFGHHPARRRCRWSRATACGFACSPARFMAAFAGAGAVADVLRRRDPRCGRDARCCPPSTRSAPSTSPRARSTVGVGHLRRRPPARLPCPAMRSS